LFLANTYNIIKQLKQSYTLDVRALSLMRIGVCLILLVDLIIRSTSIIAFFTDEGFLPVEVLKNYSFNPYHFSLHIISGELWWQILLFILNIICVIMLMIGYRTRMMTLICWVFLVSLQNRNPLILQSGDDLLRLLLLWGMFLPWGERYSIKKQSYISNQYFSIANIGYMLLACSVYFFSALLKTSPEWIYEGTAIYYALSLDQIRLPLGTVLYQFPWLMKALTHLVWYIELIAPLLIITPFVPSKIRVIGILSIVLLFMGIASTLFIGLFYIIGIVSLIGMLPGRFIDGFEKRFYKNKVEYVFNTEQQNTGEHVTLKKLVINNFLVLIIVYCLILNLSNVKKFPFILEDKVLIFGNILRLEQSWGMFAPGILKEDGYYVYSGKTMQEEWIDIKHDGEAVSYLKPKSVIAEYENDRWRKLAENVASKNLNYMRPHLCSYLLRKWNKENPAKPIKELIIFYMKETSLPNYQTKPIEKLALCNCFSK
jgi:hypothetical protein